MIVKGSRTEYEPKDYPVAPWAQRMAEEFERGRIERRHRAEEQAQERVKEDKPCQQK